MHDTSNIYKTLSENEILQFLLSLNECEFHRFFDREPEVLEESNVDIDQKFRTTSSHQRANQENVSATQLKTLCVGK